MIGDGDSAVENGNWALVVMRFICGVFQTCSFIILYLFDHGISLTVWQVSTICRPPLLQQKLWDLRLLLGQPLSLVQMKPTGDT